ncbi:ParB N-terminal domain-containing protein [Agrobacterium rosae]|uniref:ParB N-terminal domain-containing protein n=1 Tax=Agrobacterium rosae TaxID=1972867 RepID=UPI003A80B245
MNINSSGGYAEKRAENPSCDAFVAFLLIPQEELRASEKINIWRARSLAEKIESEGVWSVPILVEKHHNVVMDGHHRLWAAKELGLRRVPCMVTDYDNPHLSLTRWVSGEAFLPGDVIKAGKTGELLDYKTTRHIFSKKLAFPKYSVFELRQG